MGSWPSYILSNSLLSIYLHISTTSFSMFISVSLLFYASIKSNKLVLNFLFYPWRALSIPNWMIPSYLYFLQYSKSSVVQIYPKASPSASYLQYKSSRLFLKSLISGSSYFISFSGISLGARLINIVSKLLFLLACINYVT